MTTIELYRKHNYPLPPSISLLADFGERYTSFEAMLAKKSERLQIHAQNENPSPFVLDKETEELWAGYETLDYLAELYEKSVKEIDDEHLYGFYIWRFGPVQFTGKELQREINKLKKELNIA